MKTRNARTTSILVGLLATLCCLWPVVAEGQTNPGSEFAFTPRFWLSTIDPLVGVAAVKEAYLVPTYGATVSFSPHCAPTLTFEFTGLYGSGHGDALIPGGTLETISAGVPVNMTSIASLGESDGKRKDFEFMIRHRASDRWYSLHFGLRYANWNETTAGQVGYAFEVGPILGQTISDEEVVDVGIDLECDYYGVEMGFGTIASLSNDGAHALSTDFTLAAAYTKLQTTLTSNQNLVPLATFLDLLGVPETYMDNDHLSTGMDVSAGYQYRGNGYGFSLSYHLLVLFEENVLEFPQLTAVSGPEVAISLMF